jgi:hypothetical protein
MKSKFAFSFVAAAAALALTSPLLAAGKKTEKRRESLVAALQAVSPDALGGRLGFNIATATAPTATVPAPAQPSLVKSTGSSSELLAYLSWKGARKS